ncbi:MAG TPA: DUF2961 domain-containing protein [Abditibacterium sp.]
MRAAAKQGWLLPLFLFVTHASAQTLENLPPAPNLPPFRWFASTDSKHQNQDYFLLQPGQTRRVPLGAGTLERLWSTLLFPMETDLVLQAGKGRRQVLLSGGRAQRGLIADKTFVFFPGLKRDPLANLGAGAALIATNRAKTASKWYFQAAVRPKTASAALPAPKSVARRQWKLQLAPGEEKQVETFDSPGQINEFSVASDLTGAAFHDLRLQIRFEGQLAVDAPLLSLAGQVAGEELVQNAVAEFDGSRLVLRWPMPFERAEISLQNTGAKAVSLDVGARMSSFDKAPSPFRFCAISRTLSTKKGEAVEILDVKGAGAFVGLALAIAPGAGATRRTFAYLEGNETIRADGQSFEGTGTEDFFSSAWYFPDKPFSRPYEGLTQKIAAPPSVAAYRWMIPDAVPFRKSLRFDFEHGQANNTSEMNWNWTPIWYQTAPISLPDAPAPNASTPATPKPDERWKLGVAVALGVVLGVASRRFKRKKQASY